MKSIHTQGPKRGYKSDEKDAYRWDVVTWLTVNRKVLPTDVVLCLPSYGKGEEIAVWLSKGFREDQIIAVDRDPYVIYNAPWRKLYPGVKFMIGEIEDVFMKLAAKGIKVHYANLDLCGMASPKTAKMLKTIRKTNVFADNARVAFTIQRGRDDRTLLYKDHAREVKASPNRTQFAMNCLMGIKGHMDMHDASYKAPKKNGDRRVPVMEYIIAQKK